MCAPTGAGKTNIAMITVLREIGANMHYGIIQKAEFKVQCLTASILRMDAVDAGAYGVPVALLSSLG